MKGEPYREYRDHLRDERNHMEGLLNQRFNLFLIVVGAVIASIPYAKNSNQLATIFIVGFTLALFVTLLIGRAQWRLDITLKC